MLVYNGNYEFFFDPAEINLKKYFRSISKIDKEKFEIKFNYLLMVEQKFWISYLEHSNQMNKHVQIQKKKLNETNLNF